MKLIIDKDIHLLILKNKVRLIMIQILRMEKNQSNNAKNNVNKNQVEGIWNI